MAQQNLDTLARDMARRLLAALDRLGIGHQTVDGRWWGIALAACGYTADGSALAFTVDTDPGRLPRGVSLALLEHPRVLRHLEAVLGHPVYVDRRRGFRYVVRLREPERVRLPRMARLDARVVRAIVREGERRRDMVVGLGFARRGRAAEHWWLPWGQITHMLVGGSTGGGKSTFLQSLLFQVLHYPPQQVRLVLADGKQVTFAAFADLPHLFAPLALDTDALLAALQQVLDEMDRRQALFRQQGRFAEGLAAYNRRVGENDRLPRLLMVVDEAGDWLAATGGKRGDLHHLLQRIAMLGRALGVHLVLSGQNLRAAAFGPALRDQLLTRVQFRAADAHQARVVGAQGAERLRVPGRAIVQANGEKRLVQTYYVSREEVVALAERLRARPLTALSDLERELVRFAVQHLGGRFIVNRLHAAFRDHLTHHQVRTLAERWQARGWLTAPRGPLGRREARRVTPELLRLAGLDPTEVLRYPHLDARVRTALAQAAREARPSTKILRLHG